MRNTMNDRYMKKDDSVIACTIKDVATFVKDGYSVCDKCEYDASLIEKPKEEKKKSSKAK